MKKSNKIMLLCFSAAAIAAAGYIVYKHYTAVSTYACIYDGKELVHKIDLNKVSKPYTIQVGGNTILIEKGQVSMLEADCPDKLCVKQGAISNDVSPIICLPNDITVKITGDENDTDITMGM